MHSYIKYIRVFSLAVTILSFSFVSVSHAVDELFKSIDENTDGKINQKEFSKEMKDYIFNELDINNNKAISESEWISIEGVIDTDKHEKLFQRLDTDKDKRISFFEFSNYADNHSNIKEAFIALDKDENNVISPDEITARPLFKMITIKIK